jgi:thiamine biosynthesis protein ThiS
MVTLTINGKPVELEREMALPAFLDLRGIDRRHIAVARNGDVLDRGAYDEVLLRAGDVIEIVRMVGGG